MNNKHTVKSKRENSDNKSYISTSRSDGRGKDDELSCKTLDGSE